MRLTACAPALRGLLFRGSFRTNPETIRPRIRIRSGGVWTKPPRPKPLRQPDALIGVPLHRPFGLLDR